MSRAEVDARGAASPTRKLLAWDVLFDGPVDSHMLHDYTYKNVTKLVECTIKRQVYVEAVVGNNRDDIPGSHNNSVGFGCRNRSCTLHRSSHTRMGSVGLD